MFRVKHVITGEVFTVYSVSGMHFLAWNLDMGCWEWVQMEKYAPVAEPCDAPYWATEQAYKNGYEQGKKDARKKGRWVEHRNEITGMWHYDCPFCDDGYAMKERDKNPSNFCANCGSDMRGEEDG